MSQPLPVDAVIAGATRRSLLRHEGESLYWLEQRPQAQGRGVIVRWNQANGTTDLTPDTLSVRSRVHEYGGGEFAVWRGELVFCADPDQQVWLRTVDGALQALTPPSQPARSVRYADFCWHPSGAWCCAVRECHLPDGVYNDLVALARNGEVRVLAEGADFYAAPAFSGDGQQLVWLQWSHPFMPWDETRLMAADVEDGMQLSSSRLLAGGADISVLQPGFDAHGRLLAVSDQNGFWQLGEVGANGWQTLADVPGEAAVAPWSLGQRSWCVTPNGHLYWLSAVNGEHCLWHLPVLAAEPMPLHFGCLAPYLAGCDDALFLLHSTVDTVEALIRLARPSGRVSILQPSPAWPEDLPIVPARPQWLEQDGRRIPFYLYLPKAQGDGKLPPLLLLCHSGPTGAASPALQPAIQFWTSRGYAVADVNYRGSDGFGRVWRQALLGHWGEFDVADCVAVASYLAESGLVDPARIFVRGNSAGGLTVLQMLAANHTLFRAAAVRYPVVDLEALAVDSHKFESAYLGRLVGQSARRPDALAEASPIRQVEKLKTPMLIQQGDQDPVVPLSQAHWLADALTRRGIPHELVVFAGEGHGFRRADTLRVALENELAFFDRFC